MPTLRYKGKRIKLPYTASGFQKAARLLRRGAKTTNSSKRRPRRRMNRRKRRY